MLEASEMNAFRWLAKISHTDWEKEEDIDIKALEDTIVKNIEQKQLSWYGHMLHKANYRLPNQERIALLSPKEKR